MGRSKKKTEEEHEGVYTNPVSDSIKKSAGDFFILVAINPSGATGMNDFLTIGEFKSRGNDDIPMILSAKGTTISLKFTTCIAVNNATQPTAGEKTGMGWIDDGIDLQI